MVQMILHNATMLMFSIRKTLRFHILRIQQLKTSVSTYCVPCIYVRDSWVSLGKKHYYAAASGCPE